VTARDDEWVEVDVGPVSPASARAWIAYASDTLAQLRDRLELELIAGVLEAFDARLDEWRSIAERAEPFRWVSDEPPERVQYLLNALYWTGTIVEREAAAGRARLRPPEADEFHVVLVHAALTALEHESEADAHFVEELRGVWGIARID
jgi:hypothetical protein